MIGATIKTPKFDVLIQDVKPKSSEEVEFAVSDALGYAGYAVLDNNGSKNFVSTSFSSGSGSYRILSFVPVGEPSICDHQVVYDVFDINKDVYELLYREGMAGKEVFDRMLVCPECESIPSIRPGCPSCGSRSVRPDLLVHHYACGNVDHLHRYTIAKDNGSLTCHKCHKGGLLVNCDYDVSDGLTRCVECGWSGNTTKLVGTCHKCNTSFLIDEAKDIEVMRYTNIKVFTVNDK